MSRTNTNEIYIVSDTEAQTAWDDSRQSEKVEIKLKKARALVKARLRAVKSKALIKQERRSLTQLNHEIEEMSSYECNQMNTYLLGWAPLTWNVRYDEMLKKGVSRETVQKRWIDKNVKYYFSPSPSATPWQKMLDDLVGIYGKQIKTGGTSKLIIYFHNLDYDAQHLIQQIVDQTLKYRFKDVALLRGASLYSLSFKYHNCLFELRDSMKIYNQSLAKLGANVGWQKQTDKATYSWFDLDINSHRFQNELYYFKFDIAVLAAVMRTHFQKFKRKKAKLTAAGYAEADLKKVVRADDRKHGTNHYTNLFKVQFNKHQEAYLRSAYYGGFVYANRDLLNKKLYNGIVADVNSLYPAVMLNRDYPVWKSLRQMSYQEFNSLNLHDYHTYAVFTIKVKKLKIDPDGVPCIPKKAAFGLSHEIYNIDDLGGNCELTITNLDLYWIEKNYMIEYEYLKGIIADEFMGRPFRSFILKHKKAKEDAVARHNKVDKQIAKIHLNSTYGKFAQRVVNTKQVLYKKDDGSVGFREVLDPDASDKQHNILIAVFITAFARDVLLSAIETIKADPRTVLWYCDTDAVHFGYSGKLDIIKQGKEIFDEINLPYSPNVFGKWKPEQHMSVAKYLGSKRYWEQDPVLHEAVIKGAGIQKLGKAYLIRQGIDKFSYDPLHPLIVPFRVSKKVYNGVKIFDSVKALEPTEYQYKFLDEFRYI